MERNHSPIVLAAGVWIAMAAVCGGAGCSAGGAGSPDGAGSMPPTGGGGMASGGVGTGGRGGAVSNGPGTGGGGALADAGAVGGQGGAGTSDATSSAGDNRSEGGGVSMTDAASVDTAVSPLWTGTWAAAPQRCGGTFAQRTLRQIVHTSIGGTSARVRISNTFSTGSLELRDVHLAARTSGSSIDPATDRALTFNGKPDVSIPAGMMAVSDGVEFSVKPLADVAVSFFVMAHNGATCHQSGFQTNYSVAGNMVASATLAGAQTTGSYFFLSNLDVLNPAAEGAIVTLGASITDGYISPTDANRRWPNALAVRLVGANRIVGVLNQGISADGVANAVARFDRDVLSQPNVKWVVFSDNPINDLGNFNPPPQREIDQIKSMIAKAHANGIKFLCSTLTPFEGAQYWGAQKEPGRTAINAFVRGPGSGCDGIVDQDVATHDPALPTRYLAKYNAGDSLHPNVAGLQAIADAVDLGMLK